MENGPDYISKDELLYPQGKKFQDIIQHIADVPFYKKKLSNEGINISHIKEISDLKELPFTTKEELRLSRPMERTPLNYDGIAFFFSSSGTSGNPTVYPWSKGDDLVLREVAARCMERIGVGPGDTSLILSPFGMPIMWYCMINQYIACGASVVPLGMTTSKDVIKAMSAFPITSIATLPVVGTRLFEFMKMKDILVEKNRLRHFHFGGEYLSNARRRRIEHNWNAECYDFYGLSEIFGPIAGECKEKAGLHLAADFIYVEVIDPFTKEPVPEGGVGVAVYTTLWKKAAPLLRYWSDDFVSITYETCKCGRTSPRITYLGRAIDAVLINNKIFFSKDIEEILLSFPEVSNEWEMRLEGSNEETIAKIYTEETANEVPREKIEHELGKLLGIQVDFQIVPFDSFSRENIKPRRIKDERQKANE